MLDWRWNLLEYVGMCWIVWALPLMALNGFDVNQDYAKICQTMPNVVADGLPSYFFGFKVLRLEKSVHIVPAE